MLKVLLRYYRDDVAFLPSEIRWLNQFLLALVYFAGLLKPVFVNFSTALIQALDSLTTQVQAL